MTSHSFSRLSNHGDKQVCVYKGIQRACEGESKIGYHLVPWKPGAHVYFTKE